MPVTKLERLKKQQEQLKARIIKEQSKERGKERKIDTRKKILLGASALKLSGVRGGAKVIHSLLIAMSERDREWYIKNMSDDERMTLEDYQNNL